MSESAGSALLGEEKRTGVDTPREVIAGVPLTLFSRAELFERILGTVGRREKITICHVNARLLHLANRSERWLQASLNSSNVDLMCDSSFPQLALWLRRGRRPERLAFNRWMDALLDLAEAQEVSVFFFGATQLTGLRLAERLGKRWPRLRIAGIQHGYVDWRDDIVSTELIDRINGAGADILVVGLGMPHQERWVFAHRKRIAAPVVLPCGGALDFLSGANPTAPQWVSRLGLEWLYRGLREPRRLLTRNVVDSFWATLFVAREFLISKR